MKIAIGSDELGLDLKYKIKLLVERKGHTVIDFGAQPGEQTDYPDIGSSLSRAVAKGEYEKGILICGTGIGMAMVANKVKGIRAAVCHDIYSTQRSVLSNNAQILCMGALVIGPAIAETLVSVWLDLEFVECNSSRKINKIMRIEMEETA